MLKHAYLQSYIPLMNNSYTISRALSDKKKTKTLIESYDSFVHNTMYVYGAGFDQYCLVFGVSG